MCLLITLFAAVISTIFWYKNSPADKYKLSTLCYLFWGASLMWMIDAVFEYKELGAEYFTPALSDMINDSFLGLSVVALGMVIWIAVLVIKDPKGVIFKNKK
ncbi:MAG: hypothetical protein ACI4RR_01975 [Eubacterium sp.]